MFKFVITSGCSELRQQKKKSNQIKKNKNINDLNVKNRVESQSKLNIAASRSQSWNGIMLMNWKTTDSSTSSSEQP
jgi:hypothetical protein